MSDHDKEVLTGKKSDEEVPITPIQIFILTYLYSEEIKETRKKEVIDDITRSKKSLVQEFSHHVSISLRDICLLIPSSILPENMINEDHIYNQIKILEYNHLIGVSVDPVQEKENTPFFITVNGIILIKQLFSTLSDGIFEGKISEESINQIEGNREIKDWLISLLDDLKEKSEDDVVDMLMTGIKIYGPSAIVLLINLLSEY